MAEARRCELSSHSGVQTHWALHETPHYKVSDVDEALLVQAVPSRLEDMRRIFDDVSAGRMPQRLAAIMSHSCTRAARSPAAAAARR